MDDPLLVVLREGARRMLTKPDRPRWRDYQRLGLLRPAGISKWQIPVLTVTDRAGARRADLLPDRRAESLVAVLERHVGQDAVLCSDGDGAYDLFARARALPWGHRRALIDIWFLTQNLAPSCFQAASTGVLEPGARDQITS